MRRKAEFLNTMPTKFRPARTVCVLRSIARNWDTARCSYGCEKHENHRQNYKINGQRVYALPAKNHDSAQGIHQISERVENGNDVQPVGHHDERIDGIAGKKQRHREHLANAHKTLS